MRHVLVVAILALLSLVPPSLSQDTNVGELAFLGHATNGAAIDRDEAAPFRVENASHQYEFRYNANGSGHAEFRIIAVANETAVMSSSYDAGGRYVEQAVRWTPDSGSYRLELRYRAFNGSGETSVWDMTANAAAAAGLAPPTPAPTDPTRTSTAAQSGTNAPAPAAGPPAWLTPTLIVQAIGVIGTLGLGTYGIVTVRRRQSRLAEHIDRIEKAFEATKNDHGACRECLMGLREDFKKELGKQEIEERQFLLLEQRIHEYLASLPPNS